MSNSNNWYGNNANVKWGFALLGPATKGVTPSSTVLYLTFTPTLYCKATLHQSTLHHIVLYSCSTLHHIIVYRYSSLHHPVLYSYSSLHYTVLYIYIALHPTALYS